MNQLAELAREATGVWTAAAGQARRPPRAEQLNREGVALSRLAQAAEDHARELGGAQPAHEPAQTLPNSARDLTYATGPAELERLLREDRKAMAEGWRAVTLRRDVPAAVAEPYFEFARSLSSST